MASDLVPEDEFDREALLDRLRIAEQRLALAEAQLAISKVAKAPTWLPTDGKAAELADRLHDLAPALDVLFHTAEVVMVLLSTDGTILRANQRAAELWGMPIAELCGRRTVDLTVPEDRERTERSLAAPGRGSYLMKTYVRPDGTRVPAVAMGWPLTDDDGNEVCLLGVAVPAADVSATVSALREAAGPGSWSAGQDGDGQG